MDAETAAVPLLAVGYPASIAVIARWVPVVRERRIRWLLVHHVAVLAIITGWAIRRPVAVPPNAAWLLVSTIWYVLGGRRRREGPRRRPGSTP